MALVCEQRSALAAARPAGDRYPASHSLAGSASPQRIGNTPRATRAVKCHAAPSVPVDKLPLSSYNFPALPGGATNATPLEIAVKDAVTHLNQAPFLQLQTDSISVRHSIDDAAIIEEPQLWRGINRYLREKQIDNVLLLHPLDAPASGQAARCVPSSGEVMTGISQTRHQSRLQSFAELVRAGATTADFSGRVGECCEGEIHSQVVAFPRKRHVHGEEHGEACQGECRQEGVSSSTRLEPAQYWGVILQSRESSQDSGCYVLKTSLSGVDDCTCIHWSLTRVCSSAPLFDQLSSAWLLQE